MADEARVREQADLFRRADAALLRASSLVFATGPQDWPEFTGNRDADPEHWRSWITRIWKQDAFAAAVEVASPDLARRAQAACDGRQLRDSELRRLVYSLTRYLLRMTGRATPFGLFAGVAAIRFGPDLAVRFGTRHHAVARPDAAWLGGIITDLENCPPVFARLRVVASDLCYPRGERLALRGQVAVSHGRPPGPPVEVSVRRTPAVDLIMREAAVPIRAGELADKLAAEFPLAAVTTISDAIVLLVSNGMLVSSLRPPMTEPDPLGHVLAELETAAADVGEARDIARDLREIRQMLAHHSEAGSAGVGADTRTALARRMKALSEAASQPLMVDLRLDCDITLPASVAREAETAASILARLTAYPSGTFALQDYHLRFLERYGTGCLVPVRELTDGDAGLGLPAGYLGSWRQPAVTRFTARDQRLIVLAQKAAIDRAAEVALTERVIRDLVSGSDEALDVPPHAEIVFQVEAQSRAALAAGDFRLVVTGTSRSAGARAGRFLGLLDEPDQARMTKVYAELPGHHGAIPVQVSASPLYPKAANVSRVQAVLPYQISIGEHIGRDGGRSIPLSDICVASNGQRFQVWSISLGHEIDPIAFHALDLRSNVHPVVRFLSESSRGLSAGYTGFDWGAATGMPFLPRLRSGRVVLAPARWNVTAADFPVRDARWSDWTAAMTRVRERLRLPMRVYLRERDRRLPLDLDVPWHQALLREHLLRRDSAELWEAPPDGAWGWIDGRANEVVLPLISKRDTTSPGQRPQKEMPLVNPRDHGHLPGRPGWLYPKLYAHPDRYDELLTDRMTALWDGWDGGEPDWWFIRYRDHEPHLRLRIPVADAGEYGSAAGMLGSWADRQRRDGLMSTMRLDTYYPEAGRYGTGPALDAAHKVFAADTQAVLAQLALTRRGSASSVATLAASLVDIAAGFTGGTGNGTRWLTARPKGAAAEPLPRPTYLEAVRLADPDSGYAAIQALPGGEAVADCLARRRTALASYRASLDDAQPPYPSEVLSALLHMHYIRMSGTGPDHERQCQRLARTIAQTFLARPARDQP
jgi:thiopeptide-type bacteriocin biosynthesis protein